ncbi:branched-chain amino acid ABC transporter ATP-binding protein/permease [Elioraea thermophila]|uniref:branched-chain amino acid ABC transporter ATP-binding protein/permease n=1 Tax=Elioraea thermophila TaxID=2185104 RepID=UPI000DF3857E|nr:branched-chain amino acid ABC transporter ATP-binding protein/permease [Elioraea thermophila]
MRALARLRDPLIAGVALLALPAVLGALGLGMTSAVEVVVFAIACLGLNVLVGHTGLVSFGHGAWFGLAAYAAGILHREVMPGSFFMPLLAAVAFVGLVALAFGALVLRRRGVYFSLLTLALSAMLYAVAFRWTEVTGGEDGLGGILRPKLLGLDLDDATTFYAVVAAIGFAVVYLLARFHASPIGTVLVAIRENEQRARFIGYATYRYKLIAFVVSASLTGLAGVLLLFTHRMTSAEVISVVFSGELLAMVVIGGMRSFLGPALGAFFFVIFRDLLSQVTENWLLWFGLLFVGFVVFSPTGLVGVAGRILRLVRPPAPVAAAMSARRGGARSAAFLRRDGWSDGPVLVVRGAVKRFGGLYAVDRVDLEVANTSLHALIGPNGAGKTTLFNIVSGLHAPDSGRVLLDGEEVQGLPPEQLARKGIGRSFQITNLFPSLSVAENVRLAVQARSAYAYDPWRPADAIAEIIAETEQVLETAGLAGIEDAEAGSLSYGGQRLLDLALALATRPRVLLLDEPLAGLAAAERERVSALIRAIAADLPVLLVEHDIDRVFRLADRVTVMNEGRVLAEGSAEEVRASPRVQEVYIGAGHAALAAACIAPRAPGKPLLELEAVSVFYSKSRILSGVGFEVREREIVALLGRNGAGKSTALKSIIGIAPLREGRIVLDGVTISGLPPADIARAGIAYVPQGRGLFAGMSVKENLELGRLWRSEGPGIRWDEQRVLAQFPRLRERWTTPADYLSGGEQQMAAVARALIGNTRLLLLDEPFEGLAPSVVEELFSVFDRLREEIAIVIVDHHLDLALALADRVVVLERGELAYSGEARDLAHDLELRRKVLWL